MPNLEFVSKVTSTGCGGIKISVPMNVLEIINRTSPNLVYLESATLKEMNGNNIPIKSPRLSKSNNNHRYFPIPKDIANMYHIKVGQIYQIGIVWK